MRKLFKTGLTLFLLLSLTIVQTPAGHAQTLAEQREDIIEMFMDGHFRDFSYEEVETYVSTEEANILETGTVRPFLSYGIDGQHSTAQGMSFVIYLENYFETNTTESDLAALYPHAVDFAELPYELLFYEVGGNDTPKFKVEQDGEYIKITSNTVFNSIQGFMDVFEGPLVNTGTLELDVLNPSWEVRPVNVNTQMTVGLQTAHRRDFIFSFFYNRNGGISLVVEQQEVPKDSLAEFATSLTVEELTGEPSAASDSSSWTLPHDWRMLSPRRGDVPPVLWVLMSEGDNETIAIEPTISQDGIVSGYINPNYSVEVQTEQVFSGELSPVYTAVPDSSGYFSLDVDVRIATPAIVKVINDQGQIIFNQQLPVYQYRPTALEHESGYLTLERFFTDQSFMEGYTYPYAEVKIGQLAGYAGGFLEMVIADGDGYFFADLPSSHQFNTTTNIVSVIHPETGEEITVAPYPWTEWEYENATW